MTAHNRRTFVKYAGLVGLGGALGGWTATDRAPPGSLTTGVAAAEGHLPPLRGPYADEDWVEDRGGPGNSKAIEEAPAVDPESPDCRKFYDQDGYGGRAAIVDDTMYLVDERGRVVAIDAHDATERWTSDELGVTGTPALAYHRIVASGDGKLVALDVEDGSVDWERAFDDGPSSFVVAYESVYVVADDALYALDVEDGSIQWTRDDERYSGDVAAGNGEVYATPTSREYGEDYHDVVAIDAMTGELRWVPDRDSDDYRGFDFGGVIIALDGVMSVGVANDERMVIDTETRERIGTGWWGFTWAMDDEALVAVDDYYLRTSFYRGGEGWDYLGGSLALSAPTVANDTIYVYYGRDRYDRGYEHSLLAFDKHEGEVTWTCEVQEVDEPLFDVDIVATSEAVYVFGGGEIHVVQEDDGDGDGGEDDGSGGDDSTDDEPTPTEDEPTPTEDEPTPTEDEPTPTETDQPTPTEDEPCPCDGSTGDGGTATAESTPTDEPSAGEEGTETAGESTPTDDADPAAVRTSTEETDEASGDGPGLGITSAVASLGGIGYLLRRRLSDGATDVDGGER